MADSKSPMDPKGSTEPKQGGFGAFAQQYRDRWAAGHPDAKPTSGEETSATTPGRDAPAADEAPGSAGQP